MADTKPAPGMISLDEAKNLLIKDLGAAPSNDMFQEWLKLGYLVGEEREGNTYVAEQSLQNLIEQLNKGDHKRGARLALHAVDVWRREGSSRSVAVTLATKSNVVTAEESCQDSEEELLAAAVKATLTAISQSILSPLEFKYIQVQHHSLPDIEQSLVAVLVSAGEGEDFKTLSGVAMTANSASPIEAATRATLNALNRTITPYMKEESSWREILRKLLPV